MNKLCFRLIALLFVLWMCPINTQAQTGDDLLASKEELSSLITKTNELINSLGTVTTIVKESRINLYGKLYCHTPYTAGGTGDSDYSSADNGYNLLDGDTGTHFHSDYTSSRPSVPYINVDLGDGEGASKIRFNYTTRNNGNNSPTTIELYGTNNTIGEITTASALNDANAEISIVVKNISDTNSRYFAGINNIVEYSSAVIFVWEPASEGYHYLRKYGTGEYIQQGVADSKLTFGARTTAQEFYAVEPVADGTGAGDYNNTGDFLTEENLVRFVSKSGATWINCQAGGGNPVYKSAAYGAWTAHNVYLVEEEILLATFTSTDQSNSLPTDFKSWSSNDIELPAAYRFFKFAVTASESGDDKPFFVMSEFGFTKVGIYEATVNSEYASYVTVEQLIEARRAADGAESLLDTDATPALVHVQAELENLQSIYNAIEIAKVNKHRSDLALIIEKTNALVNEVSTFETYTLQQSNISSNAGHNTADGNAADYSDGEGIAGLLDTNPATYFHSRWGGTAVGEPHYLQIDLGDGNSINNFIFSYTPRPGDSPAPSTIEIRVGNDPATIGASEPFAKYIKEKDNLPVYNSSVLWTSNVISATENCRYIRLTITKSEGPGNTQFSGQYFFAMGTLAMQCLTVNDEYSEDVEKTVVSAAINGVFNVERATTMTELQNAESELNSAYSALYAAVSAAVEKSLPVELTTDATNPIVYNILINRGDGKALQYDGVSTNMVAVADCTNRDQSFGWYFMLGNDNKVKIYPYLGRGKALATDDYSEGNSKVSAVTEGTAGYGYDWSITKITDSDWYNITILNGSTTFYFSNHGGEGNKMGFYNDDTSTDRGSMFKFEKVDYDAISSTETEVEVLKTTGELENSQGNTNNNWKYKWTSNDRLGENPALTIQVGANNMTKTDDDDYLRLYVGSGSTYTLTPAAGYYISSYSFNFVKDGEYEGTVNLVVDGVTYNPTDVEQTITSENTAVYPTGAVSFSMSGVNKGIIVSNFKVILKPMITTHVTYNYYYNSEYVASETLLAGVECKFPAPNAPKGYKNAATPEGKVTELAIKDINCEIWSINIGESLTDVWKKNTWIVLNTEDIPDELDDLTLSDGDAVESVSYKAGLIDIESSGYLAVNFSTFTKGSNRLEMVGVDLLDSNDNVVAGDYHFGYRGTNKDTNIYSLNVPQAGRYKLRYLVCFQNEADTSDGEIDINLYALQNLTLESHINDNWNTTSWTVLNTIPDAITENVKYPDDSTITVANVMEGYVDVPAGLVSVYCVYKSGSQRLDILGVDLLDAYGDVVASDYHFGYAGNSSVNNGYVMSVAKSGIYKLRYIVSFEKSGNTSNGYNRVVAMNPLEEGKLYRIKSVSTNDYCKDKYVHTYCKSTDGYDQRHLRFHSDNDISVKPLSIFTFEPVTSLSEYKMKNLHTGMYVKTFLKDNELLGDKSAAADVKVTGFAVGQVTLQIDGERPMHAQWDNSVIVDWNADADNASLWSIEEVDNSLADYSVTISSVGWSTLCLNYAVKVPEGVTAYVVKSIEANSVTIESIGDVIPAGTPVLLNGAANTYTFKYTTTEDAVSDNKLVGTYYDSYIEADANFTYFILAKYNNAAALCEIKNEFKYNDSGSIEAVGTDEEGTHFKNNANKVYLPVEKSEASGVKAYSLRIIDGATGVEEIVGNIDTGAPEGIYDLSGRRIKEMTSKGIYIVNGKKYIKK